MAATIGKNRIGVIGNGGGSASKQRQLTRRRRARASAYRPQVQIVRAGRAIGLVATNFSVFPMNMRASAFAAWRAAWLYVAFWIAKHAIKRGVGACVVSVWRSERGVPTPLDDVFGDSRRRRG
jgi:hypothetical protein